MQLHNVFFYHLCAVVEDRLSLIEKRMRDASYSDQVRDQVQDRLCKAVFHDSVIDLNICTPLYWCSLRPLSITVLLIS